MDPLCSGSSRGSVVLAQSQVPMWLVPWVGGPGGHKEAAARAPLPCGAALLWKEGGGVTAPPYPPPPQADQVGGR